MAWSPPPDGSGNAEQSTRSSADAPLVGRFVFYFGDELWEWSPEAARIHGYPAVEMRPTTDQVISHKHPEDRPRMVATLDHVRRTRAAISSRHRIIDVQGATRDVVVLSRHLCNESGNVVGNEGFYVDVTSSALLRDQERRDRERWVDNKVAQIAKQRTIIDEVKGMLMLIYRIDDQQAFDLLRWRSQVTNTKVRALAENIRDHFLALDYGDTLPTRARFDRALLLAHERRTSQQTGGQVPASGLNS